MSISIVEKSSFGACFTRLDAEFVEKSLLDSETDVMARFPGIAMSDIVVPAASLDKKIEQSFQLHPRSINYLSIDSVDNADGLAFEAEYEQIDDLPSRAQYVVREDDILVSNVRPNRGAVTLIRKDQSGFIASSGFTLLRCRPDTPVSAHYLFALLKTRYARDQLVRRSRGSMYPAVVRDDVLALFVPSAPPKIEAKVAKLLANARDLQKMFFAKKAETRALLAELLRPIGSPPSPLETRRSGIDWTEVDAGMIFREPGPLRLDAEFFRTEYEDFDRRCKAATASFLLGDHFELAPGRALTASSDSAFYAKQGILTNVGINWAAIEEAEGSLAKGAWRVKPGDILLACTAHEIAYVGKRCDVVSAIPDWTESEVGCVPDLMIIRARPSRPEYLSLHYIAAFLRHDAGLHQVQRCIRGLRGGHVYKNDLEQFVRIPMPDAKWLRRFDAIEEQAEKTRNEAKRLVMLAIETVEKFLAPAPVSQLAR